MRALLSAFRPRFGLFPVGTHPGWRRAVPRWPSACPQHQLWQYLRGCPWCDGGDGQPAGQDQAGATCVLELGRALGASWGPAPVLHTMVWGWYLLLFSIFFLFPSQSTCPVAFLLPGWADARLGQWWQAAHGPSHPRNTP